MLSSRRIIRYQRHNKNKYQYQYVSIFNDQQISHKIKTQFKPANTLNIPDDAKPVYELMQHIDNVKNDLSFVKTIMCEIKNDSNLTKLHKKQIDIGLQQINNILTSYGINQTEPKPMTLFRNQFMNNNKNNNKNKKIGYLKPEQTQLIILHIITILGLPTNTLNIKTSYSHQSQEEIYRQILRMSLMRNSQQRILCIQQLSHQQLIDIAKRIITIKSNESLINKNIKALQDIIIKTIPKFYTNYKHYKQSMVGQRNSFKKLTQFEKEELFIHWINIAEGQSRLDLELFKILYPYFQDTSEVCFMIDTFNTDIQIALYNKMNKIISQLRYI